MSALRATGKRQPKPIAAQVGPAVLRDHGGSGPPAVLVPSLINPPDVLDLDEDVSLASAVARNGQAQSVARLGRRA